MTKSIGERCVSGLKGLEDQIRESTTVEALNIYMNANIFMCSNNQIPSHIDDLILMDTILNYLNGSKDENTKRNVFNIMFMQKSDPRKVDFLVKLTSLTVTTLSSAAMDIFGFWMKNHAPRQLLIITVKRLLTDILTVDSSKIDILKLLPEYSLSFTSAFVMGLTESYRFISPNADPPSLTVLRCVLEWVRHYKQQLFSAEAGSSQSSQSSSSDESPRCTTPFPGLLFWTLTQPLAQMLAINSSGTTIVEPNSPSEQDHLISNLHFELLSYLDERQRSHSSSSQSPLLSVEFMRFVVDNIKRLQLPQTPLSPPPREEGQLSPVPLTTSGPMAGSNLCQPMNMLLIRLAEVVQIGLYKEAFQASLGEMKFLLEEIRGHEYIDAVLNTLG